MPFIEELPPYYPDASKCPPDNIKELERYINEGIPPNSFLIAVLKNDLSEAFALADDNNLQTIHHTVSWVYYNVPAIARRKGVGSWIANGGLEGLEAIRREKEIAYRRKG